MKNAISAAEKTAQKFRKRESESADKADAATKVLNEAKFQASRATQTVTTAKEDLTTASNQAAKIEDKIAVQKNIEKKNIETIFNTQNEIQNLIRKFEESRSDVANYLVVS